MVRKEMQAPESLSMENHRNSAMPITSNDTSAHARRSRRFIISMSTMILLIAFFIITLLTASFITYNFSACEQTLNPTADENVICTTVRKHAGKTAGGMGAELGPDGKPRDKYERDVRLPRSIKPLKYNISIVPYMQQDNFTFDGEVVINFLVLEHCFNITMHAIELNISRNEVDIRRLLSNLDGVDSSLSISSHSRGMAPSQYGAEVRIRKQYLLEAKQFFVIELHDKLIQGEQYEIAIRFKGRINDNLQGFYRSSYQVGNETRWLASTQFQATDARRAFPCFDEPALKANFTLKIARPSHLQTISNMPLSHSQQHETIPNYTWDYFEESVPMSTYLVAFTISDFKSSSNGTFSVWARRNAIQSADYALSIGPRILKFLEEYFGIPFPLPKMDLIALPDFSAGAMENWGLITFRETSMLYENGISASTNKQRITLVVAHELAHQWFGNLVTPSWWTDLWLNEGFANYMEFLAMDAIAPEWNILDQFCVNELQSVFQMDALSTSHKISVEVANPDEILEIFDLISYDKGATILRMLNHSITSEVFRSGLSKYLTALSYSSADQDDLWRFLTIEAKSAGLLDNSTSVKDIMDTWTLQVGYPVLHIARHPNKPIIVMQQERFVFVKDNSSNEQPLWWIPITYTTSDELNFSNTRPRTWLPRKKVYEIESQELSTPKWFIFNIQQTGYYRINYEPENWVAITEHLMQPARYTQIVATNRAQLIDDALNLARGGYLSYDIALNLTRYLAHETAHVPWKAALTALTFIDSMLFNQGEYDLLKNYFLRLLEKVYQEVGFDDKQAPENMLQIFKRIEILYMACHWGHRDCIAETSRRFQNWLEVANPDANNPIPPNLRHIVYCSAIKYGSEQEWDFAFERYQKSTVSTEQEQLLTALGCSREPWILYRYLKRAISVKYVRKQDISRVFGAVASNPIGQHIVFDFLRENWLEINTYLGSAMASMNNLLRYATKVMNSKFLLAEVESFIKIELKENGRSMRQVIEQVQNNVEWMNHNYHAIIKWLKAEKARNEAL